MIVVALLQSLIQQQHPPPTALASSVRQALGL